MVLEMTYSALERAVNPTHDIKLFAGRSNPQLAQEIAVEVILIELTITRSLIGNDEEVVIVGDIA